MDDNELILPKSHFGMCSLRRSMLHLHIDLAKHLGPTYKLTAIKPTPIDGPWIRLHPGEPRDRKVLVRKVGQMHRAFIGAALKRLNLCFPEERVALDAQWHQKGYILVNLAPVREKTPKYTLDAFGGPSNGK